MTVNKSFAEYLTKNVHKIPVFKTAQVFVKQRSVWFEAESGNPIEKENPVANWKPLNNKRFLKIACKPHRIAFSLGNHSAIVVAHIAATTQDKKIAQHVERLDECFVGATSSYYAHHDELTGVLNRHGIKHKLELEYNNSFKKHEEADDFEQQASGSTDLVLFSLDIDKFKSINDTFGHDTGDYVLAIFAAKLLHLSKELETKYPATFIFGRPGGEEFDLIAIGFLSKKERISISEQILERIRIPLKDHKVQSDRTLNDATEKIELKKDARSPQVVTASIGVSAEKIPDNVEKLIALYAKLRTYADTALYRAKADGRNCAIIYSEILSRHGRVIDFDSHAEVVQIDIGSKVGVARGQVYAIFPPPIDINEIEKNGAVERKGFSTGIPIPSAKIKIIDIREDTSNGILVEKINSQEIPKNSRLKLIPNGSSLILTPQSRLCLNSSNSISDLPDRINAHLKNETFGAVIALNGRYRKDDTRPIEQKLEELISLLRINLPATAEIFSSYFSEIFVVLDNEVGGALSNIVDIVNNLLAEFEYFGFEVYAGITHPHFLPENSLQSGTSIPFYCRSTLMSLSKDIKEAPEEEKEKYRFFTEHTPSSVMHYWRENGLVSDALSDYHNFRRYGFDSPYLDNQLALAIWDDEASEHFLLAESALKRAALAEEDTSIFKANLALFWTEIGKPKEAYDEFKKIEEFILEKGKMYIIAYAKACLQLKNSGDLADKKTIARILLNAGNIEPSQGAPYDLWKKEIISELKTGEYD